MRATAFNDFSHPKPTAMTTSTALQQLRDLGAATVYEAQGAKGALDNGIKPIDGSTRIAGPAFTVDARPADNLILHYAVLKAQPGDILVVDAKGFMEAGPWGDVLTIQAMQRGIAGLVINGCVRDANLIIELGFPVFCRGLSIKGTGKNQPGQVNVPITIGDVRIEPGDIMVGDRDGLVVVSQSEVAKTIASSVVREDKEAQQRQSIAQGVSTAQLLNLNDTLARFGLV